MAALKKGKRSRRRTRIKYRFEKTAKTWSKFKGITIRRARKNMIWGIGKLPPNVIDQFPSGKWGFSGSVDARLAYVTKDGGTPTEKQFKDAIQVGPGIIGLRTRVWPTMEDALREAARIGATVDIPRGFKFTEQALKVAQALGVKVFPRKNPRRVSRRRRRNPLTRKEVIRLVKSSKAHARYARKAGGQSERSYHTGQTDARVETAWQYGPRSMGKKIARTGSKIERYARNPAREVTIYANVRPFTIYAVKGKNSNYPGQLFRHRFRGGGRATGLADGSIRLYPAPGKRLWSMIRQRGR